MISPFYLTQISPDPHIDEGLEQTHESSSFPFHILFNADRDQPKPVDRPPVSIQPTNEESKNMVEQRDRPPGSGKWMSSKMRIMRKMMRFDDQIVGIKPRRDPFQLVLEEDQGQQSNSSSTSSGNNNSLVNGGIIRVCSDCHTTKTPLWRSGPSGPKSLCNACGIRQRKARRALAEASISSTTGLVSASEKASELQQKKQQGAMKSAAYDDDQQDRTVPFKKRRKNMMTFSSSSSSAKGNKKKKKLHFDDFIISLSNNSALHRVFPQDERDAAILLMALSCGLLIRT